CKLEGAFRNMFLESKALSLLLCFQKCNTTNQPDCGSCKFLANPIEKEKIIKAIEIILSRLNHPPTIPELSIQIGINQCYLKKGFKELFGTTVYDFVQEQRMLKAKMLLSTTALSVSQVADTIGFSSASNFSGAFKKYAGVFPSELLQD
ncbi:MAG: helix-turn-helix transcriptional regulator, partial [Bacteroidota bacterium]|nr:helix-turn-helix transcriptional regulator [Bacteroidota bacterium]